MTREFTLIKRTIVLYKAKSFQIFVLGICAATLFLRTHVHPVSPNDGQEIAGFTFFGLLVIMVNGIAEMAMAVSLLLPYCVAASHHDVWLCTCCAVLCCAVLCCAVLCCAVPCRTACACVPDCMATCYNQLQSKPAFCCSIFFLKLLYIFQDTKRSGAGGAAASVLEAAANDVL